MPKILGFKADIINVKYVKYENKNEKIKAVDPLIYVCNAQIKEIGQGLANASRYHQVQIYLTEEDFNNFENSFSSKKLITFAYQII